MLESAKCKSAVRCRRHCARISKRPQRILSALLLVDCGRQQGRGGRRNGGRYGGRRGWGRALLTACPLLLTESRSQQQAPTLSPATLFIIAANAACPPAAFAPPCPLYTTLHPFHPVSPTALPPFTLCLANSLPPCCKLVTLQQILLVLSLAASSCAASLLPSSSVAASSRRSQ